MAWLSEEIEHDAEFLALVGRAVVALAQERRALSYDALCSRLGGLADSADDDELVISCWRARQLLKNSVGLIK
ncbi:hypothetical protein COO59_03870 [Mixta theicola]|uniref:Uncharacterized protein n=1 Tax=Mixta theicola TaxID=1458355 RepID=A0A2K1QDF1_9GAMM|nr:hypothetical protein [Mixta theicola]PNS13061.1 hypothetical protein COO59_03870 [Mixta theicola]GLR09323.1 hypothetical protein GCM10007905_20430 [Mixta theicola]